LYQITKSLPVYTFFTDTR